MNTASATRLGDPETCGENLRQNLKRIFEISAEHCVDCADYHVGKAAMRLTGRTAWEVGARPYLIETLGKLLDEAARREGGPIDVVVVACADTAVLSACTHVAWLAGGPTLTRTRFTVLDRCRSPLELCKVFGASHGLDLRTEVVELARTTATFPADIIVVHNLLAFVRERDHLPILRNLAGWLKPQGRLLMWLPLFPGDDHQKARLREQQRNAGIRAQIEAGEIEIEEPLSAFLARLDRGIDGERPGERAYPHTASVERLFGAAGLQVSALDEIAPFGGTLMKLRIVAGNRGG